MSLAPGRVRTDLQRSVRRLSGWLHGMPLIRRSGALRCPTADFSLHMVTCHRHVDMALWCLKSFTYFAQLSPPITIHDDGSLTAHDKALFSNQLTDARVIDRAEADRKLDAVLSDAPNCRAARGRTDFPLALKLFDPWAYAVGDVVLLLDSDVLFLAKPKALLTCALEGRACFNSDYQDAYAVSAIELSRWLGLTVLDRVNSGLMVLARRDYDVALLERYFARFAARVSNLHWHEQTAYALLMTQAGARRLDAAYQISTQPIGTTTVSHHFVNDGARLHFSTRGVKTLRRRGLLARLEQAGQSM